MDSFAVLSLLYRDEGSGEVKRILREARGGMVGRGSSFFAPFLFDGMWKDFP